jgi:copper transport protein
MRYFRWILLVIGVLWMAVGVVGVAFAHADLVLAVPAPNTHIKEAPPEIRLTFSEALEPRFSKIEIWDVNGRIVKTPASYLDPGTPTEMILIPPPQMPDGLYMVVWRAASTYDGHVTEGSFAFGVGEVTDQLGSVTATSQGSLPLYSVIVRWFNFLSFALGIGGFGFAVFVFNPAGIANFGRINVLLLWGWIGLGISTFGVLWLNVSTLSGLTFPSPSDFLQTITSTLMGNFWLMRLSFWLLMGVVLKWEAGKNWSIALLLGACLLLTQSLYSHASAVPHFSSAAILADWLHLLAMSLWVGGVLTLLFTLPPLLHQPEALGNMVARFSNYARVCVVLLILTGTYTAWLQVGRLDGLTTTDYGRALLAKLVLMLPVLGLAGVNFVFTARGLKAGQEMWGRRLRWLTGAELLLLVTILGAVGLMTAISPARNELVLEEIPPIRKTTTVQGLNIEFDILSGVVGENTFAILLSGNDTILNSVSQVQLRFDYQNTPLGTSVLPLSLTEEGAYVGGGSNMSVAGAWAISLEVSRGNQPPIETTFGVQMKSPPTPQSLVSPKSDYQRGAMWLGGGLLLLGGGFLFLPWRSRHLGWVSGKTAIAGLAVLVGIFVLVRATQSPIQPTLTTVLSFEPSSDMPARMMPLRDSKLPFLLTPDGKLYQAKDSQETMIPPVWELVPFEKPIQFAYVDSFGNLWVCGDMGAFIQDENGWRQISGRPTISIVETHGYLYILGQENLLRLESGKYRQMDIRALNSPALPVHNMVMLGNHTHVIEVDGQLYQSLDVGLSWQPLDVPEAAKLLATDTDGNLLAASSKGIQKWDTMTRLWIPFLGLPEKQAVDSMTVFLDRLYVLAAGKLYVRAANEWQPVQVEGTYFTSMIFQYPDTLWVLDAAETRLWSSMDGENWQMMEIILGQ